MLSALPQLKAVGDARSRYVARIGDNLYVFGLLRVEVTPGGGYNLLWGNETVATLYTPIEVGNTIEALYIEMQRFYGEAASAWERIARHAIESPADWHDLADLAEEFGGTRNLGYALARLRAEGHMQVALDGQRFKLVLAPPTRVYQTGPLRMYRVWVPQAGGGGDYFARFRLEPVRENGRRRGSRVSTPRPSRRNPGRPEQPLVMQHAVEKIARRLHAGSPRERVSRAFAIATVSLQDAGILAPGSRELTPYGRAVEVKHRSEPVSERKAKKVAYEKRLSSVRGRSNPEHTFDREAATWIAADHLTEDPAYYRKLARMESVRPNNVPGLDTPAFRRWFGQSVVVDSRGQPLIVYHGTTAGQFDAFQPFYRRGQQLGFGIHFTEDRAFAESYAYDPKVRRRGAQPHVYSAYLSIQRPLNADAIVVEGTPEFEMAARLAGPRLFTQLDEAGVRRVAYMQSAIDMASAKRAEKIIREAGYDGIRYVARISNVPPGMKIGAGNIANIHTRSIPSWVVFEPTQIKATSNTGTFDPADSNIYRNNTGRLPGPESRFSWFPRAVAEKVRTSFPRLWSRHGTGGRPATAFTGDDAYRLWGQWESGDRSPEVVEWATNRREAFARRHQHDYKPGGIIAAIKWGVVLPMGVEQMLTQLLETRKV